MHGRRPRELHRRPSSSRISTRPAARPRNRGTEPDRPRGAARRRASPARRGSASRRISTPSASGPSARRSTRSRRPGGPTARTTPGRTSPTSRSSTRTTCRASPRLERRGQRPALLGVPRSADGRADDPLPRPGAGDVAVPVPSLLAAGATAGDGLRLGRLDRRPAARDGGGGHADQRRAPRRSTAVPARRAARARRRPRGVHDWARPGSTTSRRSWARSRSGKTADLAVLDRDLFDRGAGAIGEARVVATFIDGIAVHETPALEG